MADIEYLDNIRLQIRDEILEYMNDKKKQKKRTRFSNNHYPNGK